MPYPLFLGFHRSAALAGLVLLAPAAARGQVRFGAHDGSHLATLTSYGVPPEVNDIAAGDLDRDGDADLVFAINSSGVRVCFDDDGTFLRVVEPQTFGSGSRLVRLVDVDGDGDLDIFAAGGGTAYGLARPCQLLVNDGTGAFTVSPTIPMTSMLATTAGFADLDGDGDQDVVLCTEYRGQNFHCWRNDGAGNFTDVSASVVVGPPVAFRRVFVADLDGDGFADLLGEGTSGQEWLRNDGHGAFTRVPGWSGTSALILATVDLDGDGDIDLMSSSGAALNDGTGTITPVGSYPPGLRTNGTAFGAGAAVDDFDGDGHFDVAGVDSEARPFLCRDAGGFVFQDVTAAWFEPHTLVDRTVDYSYNCIAAVDMDGDGDPDVVTGGTEGRGSGSTTVGIPPRTYVNAAGRRLVDVSRPSFPRVQDRTEGSETVAFGDVDGDGNVDLLVDGALLWRQNDAGKFEEPSVLPVAGPTAVGRFADVDGDGDLDVLAVRSAFWAGQPDLLLNDGAGSFTRVTATHLPPASTLGGSMAVGDVDGDGDVDAVAGSFSPSGNGSPLLLWQNDGTGRFTDVSSRLPALSVDAMAMEFADFDRDGDLDLVVSLGNPFCCRPQNTLVLLANDGTGRFTDATAASNLAAVSQWGLDVRDLDGDGDVDLALDGVSLRNDGTGVFTAVPAAAHRVRAADFDEDGVADDVLQDGYGVDVGGEYHWWGWSVGQHYAWTHDVDDDGDLDLVIRCFSMAAFEWYLAHTGMLHNLRRDLRYSALPRLGHDCRVRLRAAGNAGRATLAFVAMATALAPQPIEIPGLGRLRLDPAQILPLGLATIPDADTAAELSLRVPPVPAFAGMPLSAQALFVPVGREWQAHFSAAVTHVLLP